MSEDEWSSSSLTDQSYSLVDLDQGSVSDSESHSVLSEWSGISNSPGTPGSVDLEADGAELDDSGQESVPTGSSERSRSRRSALLGSVRSVRESDLSTNSTDSFSISTPSSSNDAGANGGVGTAGSQSLSLGILNRELSSSYSLRMPLVDSGTTIDPNLALLSDMPPQCPGKIDTTVFPGKFSLRKPVCSESGKTDLSSLVVIGFGGDPVLEALTAVGNAVGAKALYRVPNSLLSHGSTRIVAHPVYSTEGGGYDLQVLSVHVNLNGPVLAVIYHGPDKGTNRAGFSPDLVYELLRRLDIPAITFTDSLIDPRSHLSAQVIMSRMAPAAVYKAEDNAAHSFALPLPLAWSRHVSSSDVSALMTLYPRYPIPLPALNRVDEDSNDSVDEFDIVAMDKETDSKSDNEIDEDSLKYKLLRALIGPRWELRPLSGVIMSSLGLWLLCILYSSLVGTPQNQVAMPVTSTSPGIPEGIIPVTTSTGLVKRHYPKLQKNSYFDPDNIIVLGPAPGSSGASGASSDGIVGDDKEFGSDEDIPAKQSAVVLQRIMSLADVLWTIVQDMYKSMTKFAFQMADQLRSDQMLMSQNVRQSAIANAVSNGHKLMADSEELQRIRAKLHRRSKEVRDSVMESMKKASQQGEQAVSRASELSRLFRDQAARQGNEFWRRASEHRNTLSEKMSDKKQQVLSALSRSNEQLLSGVSRSNEQILAMLSRSNDKVWYRNRQWWQQARQLQQKLSCMLVEMDNRKPRELRTDAKQTKQTKQTLGKKPNRCIHWCHSYPKCRR
uniref:ARAD1A09196p n=1 Tax=Blastobotrys adeninivorans TaxID=409370 RepID=A0A060SY30_BLAAD